MRPSAREQKKLTSRLLVPYTRIKEVILRPAPEERYAYNESVVRKHPYYNYKYNYK